MACFDHDDTAPLIYFHVTLLGFDKNKQKKSEQKKNNFFVLRLHQQCTNLLDMMYFVVNIHLELG